jgi:hypothetical protein
MRYLSRSRYGPDKNDKAESKQVRWLLFPMKSCSNLGSKAGLDAIVREERTTYLADLNKAPGFVDGAPVKRGAHIKPLINPSRTH